MIVYLPLGFSAFPLFDKVFSYKSVCRGSCVFSPIPPLSYTLTLIASGSERNESTLVLHTGEDYRYEVRFDTSLLLSRVGKLPEQDLTLFASLSENASGRYTIIGRSQSGSIYAYHSI